MWACGLKFSTPLPTFYTHKMKDKEEKCEICGFNKDICLILKGGKFYAAPKELQTSKK